MECKWRDNEDDFQSFLAEDNAYESTRVRNAV